MNGTDVFTSTTGLRSRSLERISVSGYYKDFEILVRWQLAVVGSIKPRAAVAVQLFSSAL
jgi:hypothetical protein